MEKEAFRGLTFILLILIMILFLFNSLNLTGYTSRDQSGCYGIFCLFGFGKGGGLSGQFNLISPVNGATQVSLTPTLTWSSSKGASSYRVEISTTNVFTSLTIQAILPKTASYNVPGNILSQGVTYYWRVIAVNSKGQTIASNAPFSFTTLQLTDNTPPSVSVSHSPLNPSSTQTVTYSATASDASGIYEIKIFVDNSLKKTCSFVTTCSYTEGPYLTSSIHTYYTQATDNSPNKNTATSSTGSFSVNSPQATTQNLNSIQFIDVNTVVAVGTSGTFLKSTDAGLTWTSKSIAGTDLTDVSFTDANTGVVVGGNALIGGNIILRTADGGNTWTTQNSGITNPLTGVFFTDANTGTSVGTQGKIINTKNSGLTWTQQNSNTSNNLEAVQFINNIGNVVGWSGVILRTTDSGLNWVRQNSRTSFALYNSHFTSTSIGNVVGYNGLILRTIDSGSTWSQQFSNTTRTLFGVSFADSNFGYAVGSSGTLLRTNNAGLKWEKISSGTGESLNDVSVSNSNSNLAIVVGSGGIILRTIDGGNTWARH